MEDGGGQGENEREKGEVLIKDLYLGAKLATEMTTNEEWKSQPAQKTILRKNLIIELENLISKYKN